LASAAYWPINDRLPIPWPVSACWLFDVENNAAYPFWKCSKRGLRA
jgi:hypothetical protein